MLPTISASNGSHPCLNQPPLEMIMLGALLNASRDEDVVMMKLQYGHRLSIYPVTTQESTNLIDRGYIKKIINRIMKHLLLSLLTMISFTAAAEVVWKPIPAYKDTATTAFIDTDSINSGSY
jgi:hypothetical protein